MTDKANRAPDVPKQERGNFLEAPERSPGHFSVSRDPGIVVDVEIQPGDPVDSQFIRNFMVEFETYYKKKSA